MLDVLLTDILSSVYCSRFKSPDVLGTSHRNFLSNDTILGYWVFLKERGSMKSWRLIFRRLSLSSSSGINIIKVALRPSVI
jgi:hypothetical protein